MSTSLEKKKHRKTIVCKKCNIEKNYLAFNKPTPQYFDRSDICKRCEHKLWGNTNYMTFKEEYTKEEYDEFLELMYEIGYDTEKNIHEQFLLRHGLSK